MNKNIARRLNKIARQLEAAESYATPEELAQALKKHDPDLQVITRVEGVLYTVFQSSLIGGVFSLGTFGELGYRDVKNDVSRVLTSVENTASSLVAVAKPGYSVPLQIKLPLEEIEINGETVVVINTGDEIPYEDYEDLAPINRNKSTEPAKSKRSPAGSGKVIMMDYEEDDLCEVEIEYNGWKVMMDASIGGGDWTALMSVSGPKNFHWETGGNTSDYMEEDENGEDSALEEFDDEFGEMFRNKPSENWSQYAHDSGLMKAMGDDWDGVLEFLKANE